MTLGIFSDEHFMKEALKEAEKARLQNEVPVGAVIVHNNRIISRGHNLTETLTDVTAHAEMQAFTSAAEFIGGKYLKECTLYVTLEPCVMCAGAAFWTQISRVVFGAYDQKRGFTLINGKLLHPTTEVLGGVLAIECGELVTSFFQTKRK
ncbi:MAG: tRNA-specific adenosine deaminase [Bacteroidetes bacterium HGW-Bacteroidetes-16]|jgi:tRNA(adenine34) deaminase|nr:MAG: tRNA-specific adenosine deaminase [Bacteroidetes bacterium HGW-Bacteroidetes-16]